MIAEKRKPLLSILFLHSLLSPACLSQVRDFRNDVILAEACRQDVDHFCASVKPGDGKVHQCLVDHQDSLTVACRAETNHLSIAAASNVELSPSLGKACASERQAHCKGVTPGKARVFNCLLANADKVCTPLLCSTPATNFGGADVTFVVCMHVLLHTTVAELDCQLRSSDHTDVLMQLAAAMSFTKPALALSQQSPTCLTLGVYFHLETKLKGKVCCIVLFSCFGTGVQCVVVEPCCQANLDHCCADEHECKLQQQPEGNPGKQVEELASGLWSA